MPAALKAFDFGPDMPGSLCGVAGVRTRTCGAAGAAGSGEISANRGVQALNLARWSNLEYETADAPNKTAKSSQIAWGRFSMHFDRVHRSAPECTVGGGGTRGGYYQHRLEWRSWVAGRSFAQGLSQRPNAVTTSNISTVKSWRIHGEFLSLSIAYPDRTLTPI